MRAPGAVRNGAQERGGPGLCRSTLRRRRLRDGGLPPSLSLRRGHQIGRCRRSRGCHGDSSASARCPPCVSDRPPRSRPATRRAAGECRSSSVRSLAGVQQAVAQDQALGNKAPGLLDQAPCLRVQLLVVRGCRASRPVRPPAATEDRRRDSGSSPLTPSPSSTTAGWHCMCCHRSLHVRGRPVRCDCRLDRREAAPNA